MAFNPQQIEAINHGDGPCLCVAVPGSGKTTVMIERTARLIKSGVRPEEIISLTFTNKAGREMKERIQKRLGVEKVKTYMGTFHSFCALMMRRYAKYRGYTSSYTILDDGDQLSLIKKEIKDLYPDVEGINAYQIASAVNTIREELKPIKAGLEEHFANRPAEIRDQYVDVGMRYLENIRKNNLMDFSGLLYESIMVMEQEQSVLDYMQNCHKYLQVDEVQDTNIAQFRFIELLAGKHNNMFVVGDVSQSIYRFRGSRIENVETFIKKHKARVLELSLNYRSTPEIIAPADKLIRKNASHMAKEFKTENPSGDKPVVATFETPEIEAEGIANQISLWLFKEKYRPSDIAILYRMNAMSRTLEGAFRKRQIPYKIVGGFSFYERAEIKDTIAMLKLYVNPTDPVAFARIAHILPGMGAKTISVVEDAAKASGQGFLVALKDAIGQVPKQARASCEALVKAYSQPLSSMNAASAMTSLQDALNYDAHLKTSNPTKYQDRVENLEEFKLSAMSSGGTNMSIADFLQGIMLLSSADEDNDNREKVTLMTMHASKGLEFKVIFIAGAEAGINPHVKALDEPGGVEEERRLFYVAMTRAKHKLFISKCLKREKIVGKKKLMVGTSPSMFLIEAGLIPADSKHNGGSTDYYGSPSGKKYDDVYQEEPDATYIN